MSYAPHDICAPWVLWTSKTLQIETDYEYASHRLESVEMIQPHKRLYFENRSVSLKLCDNFVKREAEEQQSRRARLPSASTRSQMMYAEARSRAPRFNFFWFSRRDRRTKTVVAKFVSWTKCLVSWPMTGIPRARCERRSSFQLSSPVARKCGQGKLL